MKNKISIKLLSIIPTFLLSTSLLVSMPVQADTQAYSTSPPSGLAANKVPMFVSFGFDDNGIAGIGSDGGMDWIIKLLKTKKNPDGSPVHVTFFNTTKYMAEPNVTETWKAAYREGHEIGNHTVLHEKGGKKQYDGDTALNFSVEQWKQKINSAQRSLKQMVSGLGGNNENPNVIGFRAPYLSYNENMFKALKASGMVYDTSMQEGWASNANNKNYPWPYTLPTGIWELNVAPFVIDNNHSNKVTGFDYNMWHNVWGKNLNKAESLKLLIQNFDARLAGNRAPFMLGAHTDYYDSTYEGSADFSRIEVSQRREVIEGFIDYVLEQPDVRIVPFNNIVNWMRNPVALSGGSSGVLDLDAMATKVNTYQEDVGNNYWKYFTQRSWAHRFLSKELESVATDLWNGNKSSVTLVMILIFN